MAPGQREPAELDEAEFRQRLIDGGLEPGEASSLAARTAAGRRDPSGPARVRASKSLDAALIAQADNQARASAQPRAIGDLFSDELKSAAGIEATASHTSPPIASQASDPSRIRRRDSEIINAAAAIALEPPQGDELTFMHSLMCQCGLPRSRVAGDRFERISGSAALLVTAGDLFDGKLGRHVSQPLPYGPIPRLILAYLNTYSLRNNYTQEIDVGDSAAEFMRLLGIDSSTGGVKGSYTRFKKQAMALAACHLTLGFSAPSGQARTFKGDPIEAFDMWASDSTEQRPLWPGVMRLSSKYVEALRGHCVPLDTRALMALKRSALAMDIYTMFAGRLHRIEGRPVPLHWTKVREQFGQEYTGKNAVKDFRTEFLKALTDVLAVYPKARVKTVKTGLLLMPSPPPVPPKLP